jgi:hypothetical protein
MAARIVATLAALLGAAATHGQPARTDPAPGELCRAAEYRQLDYTIGRFRVVAGSGELAGELRVEPVLARCMLRGHWRGAIAGQGEATTWYDRHTQTWQRVFVNDDGHSLRLAGRVEDGRLVLTGRNAFFDGRVGLHRMSWQPQADGSIRQLWELSMDEGRTWETLLASQAIPER